MLKSKWKLLVPFFLCLMVFHPVQVRGDAEDVAVILQLTPQVDMIDVGWELRNASGNVTRYHVSWKNIGGSTYGCIVDSPSTNTSSCIVRPTLSSCAFYYISVQPQFRGLPTASDIGTADSSTGFTLPNAPVNISNVECGYSGDHSIAISWVGPGDCVEYNVSYAGEVLWGDDQLLTDNFTTRGSSATFSNLVPYTDYHITVTSDGAVATGSCEVVTPEEAPSAPQNLTLLEALSHSFDIQWEQPLSLNGVLRSFLITWSTSNEGYSHVMEAHKGQSIYNYTIANLTASANYFVLVRATTVETGYPAISNFDTAPASAYVQDFLSSKFY